MDTLSKMLDWILPFLLGLFASLIIDIFRNNIRNRKNRKFIKYYLEYSVLPNVIKLKDDYSFIKEKIEDYNFRNKNTISAYEGFNTKVLTAISSVDYYNAFKSNFVIIDEIISIIDFLSQDLPSRIYNDYYDFLNRHLKEKGKVGDIEHVKNCETINQKRIAIITILKSRIRETIILAEKIEFIIKGNDISK